MKAPSHPEVQHQDVRDGHDERGAERTAKLAHLATVPFSRPRSSRSRLQSRFCCLLHNSLLLVGRFFCTPSRRSPIATLPRHKAVRRERETCRSSPWRRSTLSPIVEKRYAPDVERLPAPELPAWIAREVPFTRYRVAVGDDLRMHVMETGIGLPVLMVHGNPTWGFLYRQVAMRLQGQGLRMIMPDLIGFGLSDKPRELARHTFRSHSRWLGSLIDQLDLDDVILACHDWGGPIATHAFSDRQDRLGGLVVMNTVLAPPPPGFKPSPVHRLSHIPLASDLVFRVLPFPQAALHLVQGDRSSIRGEVARAYRYPLRRMADRAAPLAMARLAVDREGHRSIPVLEECAAFVASFSGPRAMVWGRRDPILGRAYKRTKALLGDPAALETRAGHFLQEEVPDEIAGTVLEIARQVHQSAPKITQGRV